MLAKYFHNVNISSDSGEKLTNNYKGKKREYMNSILNDTRIALSKCVKYLAVVIDERKIFGQHVVAVVTKAEEKLTVIIRIIPNVARPRTRKRVVLCEALQNAILYGAPIWTEFLKNSANPKKPAKHVAETCVSL